MSQYYILYENEQVGPMNASDLKLYGLKKDSMVKQTTDEIWKKAFMFPELMSVLSSNQSQTQRDDEQIINKKIVKESSSQVNMAEVFKITSLRFGGISAIICGGFVLVGRLINGSSTNPPVVITSLLILLAGLAMFWSCKDTYNKANLEIPSSSQVLLVIGWILVLAAIVFSLTVKDEEGDVLIVTFILGCVGALLVYLGIRKVTTKS